MRAYGCLQVGLTTFLAFVFILPGIFYALYVDSWRKRCPVCEQPALIPVNSPRGQQLIATLPPPVIRAQQPMQTAIDVGNGPKSTRRYIIAAFAMVLFVIVVYAATRRSEEPKVTTESASTTTSEPPAKGDPIPNPSSTAAYFPDLPPTASITTTAAPVSAADAVRSPAEFAAEREKWQEQQEAERVARQQTAQRAEDDRQAAWDRFKARAKADGMVFIGANTTDSGRIYHEPDCPTVTSSMRLMSAADARAEMYLPAFDCHKPK
jgi:hypothetical protein